METLASLAHAVTESLELSEVLDRVAHAATELLPDSSARIWVMEGERLVLRAEHGPHGAPQSGFKGALAVGEGLTGRVAATGRTRSWGIAWPTTTAGESMKPRLS